MKNKTSFPRTVGNMSGHDFLPNPFQESTHIFTCLKGEFICVSPEEGERFKYSRVVRPASDEEVKHYMSIVYPADEEEDCCINNQFYCDDHNECAVCGSKWLQLSTLYFVLQSNRVLIFFFLIS